MLLSDASAIELSLIFAGILEVLVVGGSEVMIAIEGLAGTEVEVVVRLIVQHRIDSLNTRHTNG